MAKGLYTSWRVCYHLIKLRNCFKLSQKIYYRPQNSRMVLPSPSEREDAERQMGEDFERINYYFIYFETASQAFKLFVRLFRVLRPINKFCIS